MMNEREMRDFLDLVQLAAQSRKIEFVLFATQKTSTPIVPGLVHEEDLQIVTCVRGDSTWIKPHVAQLHAQLGGLK